MTAECDCEKRCVLDTRVVECTRVCREHVAIEFTAQNLPPSVPGQFLELRCRDADEPQTAMNVWPHDGIPSPRGLDLNTLQPFLRRPFSIADRWDAADGCSHVCVISRTVGPGTRWLERLRPGDTLNIIGPLGRGFRIPTHETALVLIGGGVGLPPMLYLARHLNALARRDVTVIFGATTRDLLPLRLTGAASRAGEPVACVELPGAANYPAIITTDDGSLGLRGRVTDGLAAWKARSAAPTQGALVIACGPDAMLRAVAKLTRALGLACQLCVERNMGCGLGTCLSCVVRVRDPAQPAGWRWALACGEGPVFDRDDLLDYTA